MKTRSKALWNDFVVSLLMGAVGGGVVHWYAGQWELTLVVGILLFGSGMRNFIATLFYLRFDEDGGHGSDAKK